MPTLNLIKMKKILLLLLVTFLTYSSFGQKIDVLNSKIEFKIGSIMWAKVKGEIKGMQGVVNFDTNNLDNSTFNVSIDVNTINTDNEKRDEHLKSIDFFDTENYPFITFQSESLYKKNDSYFTTGRLTIKDKTEDITIPFIVKTEANSTILIGEFEINRLDYNVGSNQSTMLVDKKVKITITCILK